MEVQISWTGHPADAQIFFLNLHTVGVPAIYVVMVYECHPLDWALLPTKQGINCSDELQQNEALYCVEEEISQTVSFNDKR